MQTMKGLREIMKRTKLLLAALLLFSSAVTGCAESNAAVSSQENVASLKVGYLPSPGHLLYFVAQEEGLFRDEGLNTELVMFGENNSELAALESGKIDVGAFGSSELVTFLADGHDLTVFGGAMIAGLKARI